MVLLDDRVKHLSASNNYSAPKQPCLFSSESLESACVTPAPPSASTKPVLESTNDELNASLPSPSSSITVDPEFASVSPPLSSASPEPIFQRSNDTLCTSLPPSSSSSIIDPVQRQLYDLHAIFTRNPTTRKLQNELLAFMKTMPPETQTALPKDCRTLRPPCIPYSKRTVPPGRIIYFGISAVLNMPGVDLFDKSATDVRLTINFDGLPLFRCANGVEFWPILGCIDEYQVFLIALYEGKTKAFCSNDYIRDLVEEICYLRVNGLTVNMKTYRFWLYRMPMNAPARAYILGIKGHTGYNCCPRYYTHGCLLKLTGRKRKVICYTEINAKLRQSQDFHIYFQFTEDSHSMVTSISPDENLNDIHNHSDEEDNSEGEDDSKEDDCVEEDECEVPTKYRLPNHIHGHHIHLTILTKIESFDLVKAVPFDYMHFLCEGVVKRWLKMLLKGPFKLSNENIEEISKRLLRIGNKCTPAEFQRKPAPLEDLASWKATQYRMFILYIGVAVLVNMLDEEKYLNITLLTYTIRLMTRKVDNTPDRQNILSKVAKEARECSHKYFYDAIRLYTEDFAVYNMHCFTHAWMDYEEFGPLYGYSCFLFESFLGRLKRMVSSHYEPLMQVVNKYSSLLLPQQFVTQFNREVDCEEEFFENPELINYVRTGKDSEEEYKKMKFRNFILRSDNEQDSHIFVGCNDCVKIRKIRRNITTGEISLICLCYTQKRSLFKLDNNRDSMDVGIIVCTKPTNTAQYYKTYNLSELREKCFAVPLIQNTDDGCDNWVFMRYLH